MIRVENRSTRVATHCSSWSIPTKMRPQVPSSASSRRGQHQNWQKVTIIPWPWNRQWIKRSNRPSIQLSKYRFSLLRDSLNRKKRLILQLLKSFERYYAGSKVSSMIWKWWENLEYSELREEFEREPLIRPNKSTMFITLNYILRFEYLFLFLTLN